MRASVHGLFLLYAAALAAVAAAAVLALGLPLAARGALRAHGVAMIALVTALLVAGAGAALLLRGAARPVDRLLAAAARLGGTAGELPLLGGETGSLTRAALAFERLAAAFEAERAQLAEKVTELTSANEALARARETLLRAERLATVGRLAAGLAHEVGNPLGAVTGYVDLARRRLPAAPHPDLPDALDRIDQAAARIDRTVRDLLDFARPVPPVLGPVDLAAAVEDAIRLARVQSRFRSVEVRRQLPPDLPRVTADAHGLSQVLLNVLLNAADAMGGAGRVTAAALRRDDAVVLTVTDDGPGFAEADLARVFEPFFTTKEPGAGTGLGLAICQRLMESFGGEIAAANGAEGGAVVTLRFAVHGAPGAGPAATPC